MKNFKITMKIVVFITAVIALVSCVDGNDYEVPRTLGKEQSKKLESFKDSIKKGLVSELTITKLKTDFFETKKANKIEGNFYVKGYVTSSDETGNFYKAFYIQDKPENPTAGLKISLSGKSLYNKFNIGREVYIRLKGLYIGESDKAGDEEVTIGGFVRSGDSRLNPISENQSKLNVLRSEKIEVIVPKVIKLSEINDSHVGMLVKVENAQFSAAEKGKSYFDPAQDFSTDRVLEACVENGTETFPLETGSFANFATVKLPSGSGDIKAVVIRNYNAAYKNNLRLAISSIEDVNMKNDRCSLATFDCPDVTAASGVTIFEENFDSFDTSGWKNVNVSGGTRIFEGKEYNGNFYASLGAYQSGENPLEVWLVSPKIDLTGKTKAELSFDTKTGYNKGKALTVFVSTDYDGTSSFDTATWIKLDKVNLADGPADSYESNYTNSGLTNLKCLIDDGAKKVYVAFKYAGGDGAVTTTFQIDNFKITGE